MDRTAGYEGVRSVGDSIGNHKFELADFVAARRKPEEIVPFDVYLGSSKAF